MKRMDKRAIRYIIVHCAATPRGRHVTGRDVDAWHRRRGFEMMGYHYLVHLDGTVEACRPENCVGAHCIGKNAISIGVCYVGGVESDGVTPADTRTAEQKRALEGLLRELRARYPQAGICGHRDFARKACPCFDARAEYAALGIAGVMVCTSCGSSKKSVTGHTEATAGGSESVDMVRAVRIEELLTDSVEITADSPFVEIWSGDTLRVRCGARSVNVRKKAVCHGTVDSKVRVTDTVAWQGGVVVDKTQQSSVGSSFPWTGMAVTLAVAAAVCFLTVKLSRLWK